MVDCQVFRFETTMSRNKTRTTNWCFVYTYTMFFMRRFGKNDKVVSKIKSKCSTSFQQISPSLPCWEVSPTASTLRLFTYELPPSSNRVRLRHFTKKQWFQRLGNTVDGSEILKIGFPKRKVVFQPSFFRGYVSFREGKLLMLVVYPIMYNRFFTSQVVSRISEPSTVSPRKIRKCLDMKKH